MAWRVVVWEEEGLSGLEGDCMGGGRPRWPGGWLYGRREASVAWRMTVWEGGLGGLEDDCMGGGRSRWPGG